MLLRMLRQLPLALGMVALTLLGSLGVPFALLEVSDSVRAISEGSYPQIASNDLFYLKEGELYGRMGLGEEELIIAEANATAVVAAQVNSINYLTWETANGLFFTKSNNNGTFEPAIQLTTNPSDTDLELVVDSSKIYLLWSREINSANREIFLRSFAGGSWQAEQQITNFNGVSKEPHGCFDSQGNFYLVWIDDRKAQEQPWFRYKDSSGWSEETLALDDPNNDGSHVQVAALGATVYLTFIQESELFIKVGSGASFSEKIAIGNNINDVAADARNNLLCILARKGSHLYFKTKSNEGWTAFHLIAPGSEPDIWVKSSRISCTFVSGSIIQFIDLIEQEIVNEGALPKDYSEEDFDEAFNQKYYKRIIANQTLWDRMNEKVSENFLPGVWDKLEEWGFEKISEYPIFALIGLGGFAGVMWLAIGFFTRQKKGGAEDDNQDRNG